MSMNGQIYGSSLYMQPKVGSQLVAEAELENFAPCACVCVQCCVPDKARKRTYIRAYENRIETNWPIFPCLCCSKERCMSDNANIYYFDSEPSQAGMCCYCIPCICCGPPVVFNHIPRCCCACIDCRPCFGEQIRTAPCDCGGLRCCICCGTPCYYYYSVPFLWPVKNGEVFLAKWEGALDAYGATHGLRPAERAKFTRVADRCCDCDKAVVIPAEPWPPVRPQAIQDRGDEVAP